MRQSSISRSYDERLSVDFCVEEEEELMSGTNPNPNCSFTVHRFDYEFIVAGNALVVDQILN